MRQQINLIPSESRRVWVFFLPPFSLSFCITAIKCFALAGGDPYTPPRLSFSTAICQGNVTTDAPGYQTASERRAEQQIRPARPQPSVKAGRWRVQVQQDFCLNPIVKLPDSLGCDKQPAKSIRTRAEKKPKKKKPSSLSGRRCFAAQGRLLFPARSVCSASENDFNKFKHGGNQIRMQRNPEVLVFTGIPVRTAPPPPPNPPTNPPMPQIIFAIMQAFR